MDLNRMIQETKPLNNQIALFWLGQAGFIIKDENDTIIAIDPYLTDCCERIYGYKRLTPKLISPEQLKPDLLFLSHQHEDHLDVDAVPVIASSSNAKIIGSETAMQVCAAIGVDKSRLTAMKAGAQVKFGSIVIEARFADHGESAPDAIGVTLDIHGIRVYYAGDTAYRPEKLDDINDFKPHIAILPINGAYGNMNAIEASDVAKCIGAKLVIPCHYWTFKEHCTQYGDPLRFSEELSTRAPQCKPVFMAQGERYITMLHS